MVKQVGVPTFFMVLSSAHLKWNELVSIINKLRRLDLLEEDIELSRQVNLLSNNQLLAARHF